MTKALKELPKIRVAAIQAASRLLDAEGSIRKACRLIKEAADLGVRVAVFPECFIPGYPIWFNFYKALDAKPLTFYKRLYKASLDIAGPELKPILTAARQAKMVVALGICERTRDTTGTLYNSLLYIDNHGEILGIHRKLVPTVVERIVHSPGYGRVLPVFATEMGRIGGLICGENSNPLAKFHLMSQGETIHAAAWPPYFFTKPMSEVIQFVSRALAYENKVFVINAAGILSAENIQAIAVQAEDLPAGFIQSSGGSSIISPTGDVLAGPVFGKEEILCCDVDLNDIISQKMIHDFAGHYNRPDIFSLSVKEYTGAFTQAGSGGHDNISPPENPRAGRDQQQGPLAAERSPEEPE